MAWDNLWNTKLPKHPYWPLSRLRMKSFRWWPSSLQVSKLSNMACKDQTKKYTKSEQDSKNYGAIFVINSERAEWRTTDHVRTDGQTDVEVEIVFKIMKGYKIFQKIALQMIGKDFKKSWKTTKNLERLRKFQKTAKDFKELPDCNLSRICLTKLKLEKRKNTNFLNGVVGFS